MAFGISDHDAAGKNQSFSAAEWTRSNITTHSTRRLDSLLFMKLPLL
jgi:hypothetical protein